MYNSPSSSSNKKIQHVHNPNAFFTPRYTPKVTFTQSENETIAGRRDAPGRYCVAPFPTRERRGQSPDVGEEEPHPSLDTNPKGEDENKKAHADGFRGFDVVSGPRSDIHSFEDV